LPDAGTLRLQRRVHVLLRREGRHINQKRTRRIYRELGLQLRNKTPKRRVKAKLRDDRRPATRAISLLATISPTLDKVSFGTNWVAEAEHGG
jgi:hypothetical protein